MESKAYAFWSGLFTLGLILVLILVAGWMSRSGQQSTNTHVFVTRQSVAGLNQEAQVLLRGIPVGRVTGLALDPQDRQQVRVTAEIDEDAPLSTTMYGKLKPQGITGLMVVELFEEGSGKPLPPDQPIPMRPSDLQQFSEAITDIVGQLKQVSSNLNDVMDEGNRQRLKQTLAQVEVASRELPGLVHDTRAAVNDARGFMHSVQRSASGVQRSFAGIERDFHRTTGQLDIAAQKFGLTLDKVDGTMTSLNDSAAQLDRVLLPGMLDLVEQFGRTADTLDEALRVQQRHPNRLLFGQAIEAPGPGEPGFRGDQR